MVVEAEEEEEEERGMGGREGGAERGVLVSIFFFPFIMVVRAGQDRGIKKMINDDGAGGPGGSFC